MEKCIRCERERLLYEDPSHVCKNCYKTKFGYKPNSMPLKTRILYIAISTALIGYSAWAVWSGKVYLVTGNKRGRGALFEVSEFGLGLGITSLILFSASMVVVIIDHYDKRDNEKIYTNLSRWTIILGLITYVIAILFFSKKI